MNVRLILAAASLTAVTAAGPAACATTEHPAAPTTTATKPASAKPVVTKKPTTPAKTTTPAPAPKTTPSRHYTEPTDLDVEVQTMCDANGNAYDIHPNTPRARKRAAQMCNNLQVGLDDAGF